MNHAITRLRANISNFGLIFASCAMAFNVGMDILAKFAAEEASPWQIVFFRFLFGFLILIIPFALQSGATKRSFRNRIHFIRVFMNLVGSYCLYHAISTLPLAIVLTIFFMEPVLATFAAFVLLREPVSRIQIAAGISGFTGVLVITLPGLIPERANIDVVPCDIMVALTGVTSWAIMKVLTKKHSEGISVITLSFWLAAMTSVASMPMAIFNWQPLSINTYTYLAGTALSGAVYNYMWLSALLLIPVAKLANLSYMALPISFVAGYLLFDEVPSISAYLGSMLIIAGIFMSSNQPNRL